MMVLLFEACTHVFIMYLCSFGFGASVWKLLGTQKLRTIRFLGSSSETCDERKWGDGVAV